MRKFRKRLGIEQLESRRCLTAFTVTSLRDGTLAELAGDGELSLREAIEAANTNTSVDGSPAGEEGYNLGFPGGPRDQIYFADGLQGTISMQAGEFAVSDHLVIEGPGPNLITIDAGQQSRIFASEQINEFESAILNLSGLSLVNGFAALDDRGGNGGAIFNEHGWFLSDLHISGSIAEGNGGGVYGSVDGFELAITENTALGQGGGIYARRVIVSNTTIALNKASDGGGVYMARLRGIDVGNMEFRNSTIAGNHADTGAGGFNSSNGRVSFVEAENSLFVGNTIGAEKTIKDVSFSNWGFTDEIAHSIFSDDGQGEVSLRPGNQLNVDWTTVVANDGSRPLLMDNGGLTPTIALLSTSPAVDAGRFYTFPPMPQTDQRGEGFPRIVDGKNDGDSAVDIGAFEYNAELIRLSIEVVSTKEDAGAMEFTVKADRDIPVGQVVSVDFQILDSTTAIEGEDYTDVGIVTVNLDHTKSQEVIAVPLIDDDFADMHLSIVAGLSNAQGAIIDFDGTWTGLLINDEVASVEVDADSFTLPEDGSEVGEFTIVLGVKPASDVELWTGELAIFTADPQYIVFTPDNWNVPRTVVYTPVDDDIEQSRSGSGKIRVLSGPEPFMKLPRHRISVTLIDDDERGVIVTPLSTTTTEGGNSGSFSVVLNSSPLPFTTAPFPISSSDTSEGTVDKDFLVFDTDNWNIPQVVTVTGVDDTELDGDAVYQIIIDRPSGTGVSYHQIDPDDVTFVNLDNEAANWDFGDAPPASLSGLAGSYPTATELNGARHLVGDLRLGLQVDTEEVAQLDNLDALADDLAGTADEDGVVQLATMVVSPDSSTVSSITATVSDTGFLDAWIDFNRDGDWDDADEQVLASQAVIAGFNVQSIRVPAGASPGNTYARFRLSSTGGLAPTGPASDGEVEDYLISLIDGSDESALAEVQLLDLGPAQIDLADGQYVVSQASTTLYSAPIGSPPVTILGSAGGDVVEIVSSSVSFGDRLKLDLGTGANSVHLLDGGHSLDVRNHVDSLKNVQKLQLENGGNSVLLNDAAVEQMMGGVDEPLRISHQESDSVEVGNGWSAEQPVIADGDFQHVLTHGELIIHLSNDRAFHNPLFGLDTNGSGNVSPIDVLLIINAINDANDSSLQPPNQIDEVFNYIDTSGDGSLSPLDALLVINHLNSQANGEGEDDVAPLQLQPAMPVWYGDLEDEKLTASKS